MTHCPCLECQEIRLVPLSAWGRLIRMPRLLRTEYRIFRTARIARGTSIKESLRLARCVLAGYRVTP